jgi:hypothetical protein
VSLEDDLRSARAVADAVMYEGYLLYPYRASAAKNQVRWQFGVLGPQGAAAAGVGEAPDLGAEILVRHSPGTTVTIRLRFLQLESRVVERVTAAGDFVGVEELQVDDQRWRPWDEATEHEVTVACVAVDGDDLDTGFPVSVQGSQDIEELRDRDGRLVGRLVRRRRPLRALVHVRATRVTASANAQIPDPSDVSNRSDVSRLGLHVENLTALPATRRPEALGRSLLGAHLLLTCELGELVSLLDPPPGLEPAARECRQHRCWPVLAGPRGSTRVLLVSPIILEDHPALAQESAGTLFDSTEIDEILTLRILTMTDQEKAEARATDPRAAEIIDRSERLSPEELARMHGALRDPHALEEPMPTWSTPTTRTTPASWTTPSDATTPATWTTPTDATTDVPWWDPERDASVDPGTDTVMIAGRAVGRGSLVRIRPNRRADAQDLFFADQPAKVTGVHFDVDGETHVGVVLVDDPAADVNEWYGRFLYFAPDELEPLEPARPDEPNGSSDPKIPAVQWKES